MLNERQRTHLSVIRKGVELHWCFEDEQDYDKGGAWFLYDEAQDIFSPFPVAVEDAIALQESGKLEQLTVIGDAWGYKHEQ